MNNILGRFGCFLAVPAMAGMPVHFPGLAAIGVLFGVGGLAEHETTLFYGMHVLVVAMWLSHLVDYKRNSVEKPPLVIISISVVFFFLSLYVVESEALSYVALAALVASSVAVWFAPPLQGYKGES